MLLNTLTTFGASLMSLATSVAAFDAAGSNNVVLYWGQASAGSQEPLGTYCESNAADVYVVSFLNSFNGNGDLTLTISGCNDNFAGGLAKCPAIAADIKKCQSLGKKVFISLGGAVGSYGFTSDAGGANFADTLWNTFGGGNAAERPFGDAVVDGYDLDIENQQQMGYVALVKRLREHFASSSGQYYISATPQCPYPDASVGEALAGADIDFAYVQFYNNYCGVNNPGQFNFDTWDNFAKTVSPNKNIKIYLGVPAAVSAASTGYIDGATLKGYVDKVKQYSSFGGIMMWDASQAFINKEGGQTYAEIAKEALGGSAGAASVPVASVPASSVAAASVPVSSAPVAAPSSPAPSSPAPWAPSSSPAPWAPSSSPAPWAPSAAPVAPGPVVSSAPAAAPVSSHTPDNGMWKPENPAPSNPAPSSVSSLAAPSGPVFAAESGAVGEDTTVTEQATVTSVGETVVTTVPQTSEAATSSIPQSSAANVNAPAAPSSSKAKHTVYHTTIESVYVDTTIVNVPGPSPTGGADAAADAPASVSSANAVSVSSEGAAPVSSGAVSAPAPSSVSSLAAPSGPAFNAESGEVKNKPENGTEAALSSSSELTTTTTSSVFTTQTVTGTTVSVSVETEAAAGTTETEAAPSTSETAAGASSVETSSAASSAPASSAAPASSVQTSASSTAKSSAAEAAADAPATSSTAPSSSASVVAPSDLLSAASTVSASASVTISLADSAPQKTISPESAHPPCDGKQGNELAKCLNGIYGNQEVISKLSIQDKQKSAEVTKPSSTEGAAAVPTEAAAKATSTAEAPAAESKASSTASSAAAPKPTEAKSEDKPADASSDKPAEKSDSEKPSSDSSTPPTTPLASSGCTEGEVGCSPSGEFIMCNFNKWVHFACPPTTTCFATAQGKNAVVGCNFIDAPIPLLKRNDEPLSHRPPPTLQQRRQQNVDVFAMLK